MSASIPLQIVLSEGRENESAGAKLLLASLRHHAPDADVLAYLNPQIGARWRDTLTRIHPRLHIVDYGGPEDWTCKPTVLLDALARDPARRALWIDVDILAIGPLDELARETAATVITAEESNPNDNARVIPRQQALGMSIGAPRPTTLSSCVIGVTAQHAPLLEEWKALMSRPAFLEDQSRPASGRKLFYGDQEVWEAVLCAGPHQDIALRVLCNDAELVQANYAVPFSVPTPSRPMFVHATGNLKPWRSARHRLTQEMFPYFTHARPYLDVLTAEERAAFCQRSKLAWLWQHALGGFRSYRWVRRTLRRIPK